MKTRFQLFVFWLLSLAADSWSSWTCLLAILFKKPALAEQILIAKDQSANAAFDGWADETISSRMWRTRNHEAVAAIDWFLGNGHCLRSYTAERTRAQLPPEIRSDV